MGKILAPIKQRILQFIEFKGLAKIKFLENLGLSASNFRGDSLFSEVGGEVIAKILSQYPELSPEWLLTENGNMIRSYSNSNKSFDFNEPNSKYKLKSDVSISSQAVPLYDIQATASVVELFRDKNNQKPIDHITIPNLPKCDGAIYVSGDSMYPLLKSGDIIMYKNVTTSIDNMFWGEMYLVSLINDEGDDFIMIKWLHKSTKGDNYVTLVSENRHHQPKDFHVKNIKGLALIKASVRVNSMY